MPAGRCFQGKTAAEVKNTNETERKVLKQKKRNGHIQQSSAEHIKCKRGAAGLKTTNGLLLYNLSSLLTLSHIFTELAHGHIKALDFSRFLAAQSGNDATLFEFGRLHYPETLCGEVNFVTT